MIQLTKRWALDVDRLNVILMRLRRPEDGGAPSWVPEGYYGNLRSAVYGAALGEVRSKELTSLRELSDRIEAFIATVPRITIADLAHAQRERTEPAKAIEAEGQNESGAESGAQPDRDRGRGNGRRGPVLFEAVSGQAGQPGAASTTPAPITGCGL